MLQDNAIDVQSKTIQIFPTHTHPCFIAGTEEVERGGTVSGNDSGSLECKSF